MKLCAFYRCGHDKGKHTLGLTIWGDDLWQCDDCSPGEMAGNKWHKFKAVAA